MRHAIVRTVVAIAVGVWMSAGCSGAGGVVSLASRTDPATPSNATPSPSTSPSASSGTTNTLHSDAAGGFTIEYPATWTESPPTSDFYAAILLAPTSAIENDFRPNVNIVVEPLNVSMSSEQYANAGIKLVKGIVRHFEELDRGTLLIDGIEAIWIEYHGTYQDQPLKDRQVIFVHESYGVVITFSATDDSFDDQVESELLIERTMQFDA